MRRDEDRQGPDSDWGSGRGIIGSGGMDWGGITGGMESAQPLLEHDALLRVHPRRLGGRDAKARSIEERRVGDHRKM